MGYMAGIRFLCITRHGAYQSASLSLLGLSRLTCLGEGKDWVSTVGSVLGLVIPERTDINQSVKMLYCNITIMIQYYNAII